MPIIEDSRVYGQEEGVRRHLADRSRLVMWEGAATMRQASHLLCVVVVWAGSMALGDLFAQQPVSRSQSGMNINSQKVAQPLRQGAHLGLSRRKTANSDVPYIVVFGAVKSPTVFETTELAIPLQTLIERAGGETIDSIHAVRILEHAAIRYKPNLPSTLSLQVARGQIVFVVPRGGKSAQRLDPRQVPPDRFVLISGLDRRPLLFNVGKQSRTFSDLLLSLGQSPDLVERNQVIGTQPQGVWMDADSPLIHNTGIHFEPESVNQKGYLRAVEDGFEAEPAVPLEIAAVKPPERSQAVQSTPNLAVPLIEPRRVPVRMAPPPPATTDVSHEDLSSEIEPAGSSIRFDEPMPAPGQILRGEDREEELPRSKSNGQPPLMMPRSWDDSTLDEVEDSSRDIERTSANASIRLSHIQTASAEIEVPHHPLNSKSAAEPAPADNVEVSAPQVQSDSAFASPQSWLALGATVGVALISLIVTRLISPSESVETAVAHPLADSASTESVVEQCPSHSEEQRFLQRLILNKVPLIEEEATLPPIDRLHGMSVGGRRLVIHEAQERALGPHFKVRESRDTREVELRLRGVMRADASSRKSQTQTVTTADVEGSRVSKVSPLERALRNVERGDTT